MEDVACPTMAVTPSKSRYCHEMEVQPQEGGTEQSPTETVVVNSSSEIVDDSLTSDDWGSIKPESSTSSCSGSNQQDYYAVDQLVLGETQPVSKDKHARNLALRHCTSSALSKLSYYQDLLLKYATESLGPERDVEEAQWKDPQLESLVSVLKDLRSRVAGRTRLLADEAVVSAEVVKSQWKKMSLRLISERAEAHKLTDQFKQVAKHAAKAVVETQRKAEREVQEAQDTLTKVTKALEEEKARGASKIETLSIGQSKAKSIAITKNESAEDMEKHGKEVNLPPCQEPTSLYILEQELDMVKKKLACESRKAQQLEEQVKTMQEKLQGGRERGLEVEHNGHMFEMQGDESLGGTLTVVTKNISVPAACRIQWYRLMPDNDNKQPITGAKTSSYAPEPADVGCVLQACIDSPRMKGGNHFISTIGSIAPVLGLESLVEHFHRQGGAEFKVLVLQKNGLPKNKASTCRLDLSRDRIRLRNTWKTKASETYTSQMQVFGARGGGAVAARGLCWVPRKGLAYLLLMESTLDRNAVIMLSRRLAKRYDLTLTGPALPTLGDAHSGPI